MKNRLFIRVCAGFFLLLALEPSVSGQFKDAGLWTSVTLEKKIVKGLDFIFTEELRLNENITEAGAIFTEGGFEYKIYGRIKAGLFYRYINRRNTDDTYRQSHRFFVDLSYRPRIGRFEIAYRIRFQTQYTDINRRPEGMIPDWYIRHKLQASYNTRSRFDPFLSGELWHHLAPAQNTFDNLRVTVGVETRITKIHSIDVGYIFQRQFYTIPVEEDYIIFIGYKASF